MPTGFSADVENEFRTLNREAGLLAEALPAVSQGDAGERNALRWIEIAGVAAAVEKIYSGCERVLLLIAKRVDNAPVEKTDAWHATLLNRMVTPLPGVRVAVISEDCKSTLDRFRSFRHRVRNNYGVDLDDQIVLERAAEIGAALPMFREQVMAFLDAWTNDDRAADR